MFWKTCFELNLLLFIFHFRIHWNTLMKILYLNSSKCFLSQNQQVRIDFHHYRWYKPLAKHIRPFLKQTLKWKDVSAWTINRTFLWYFDNKDDLNNKGHPAGLLLFQRFSKMFLASSVDWSFQWFCDLCYLKQLF